MAEKAFDCLISIEAYDEAHAILIQKMFPVVVRSTSSSDLERALEVIREKGLFQHQHQIAQWSLGGGMLQSIHTL